MIEETKSILTSYEDSTKKLQKLFVEKYKVFGQSNWYTEAFKKKSIYGTFMLIEERRN